MTDFRQLPGQLVDNVWYFPPVETTNAYGSPTTWQIKVWLVRDKNNLEPIPILDSYYDGAQQINLIGAFKVDSRVKDGKIKDSAVTFIESGKNIGRANQTNTWLQALRDALGLYNKQKKKIAPTEVHGEPGCTKILPMLAVNIKDLKEVPVSADKPAWVQRKYNGIRAILKWCNGRFMFTSRKDEEYANLEYLSQEVEAAFAKHSHKENSPLKKETLVLDGELYKHGARLQDLSGAVRGGTSHDLNFMVFDCYDLTQPNLLYSTRKAYLDELGLMGPRVQVVETFKVTSFDEIDPLYRRFLDEKYEGAMVRLDGPYLLSFKDRRASYLIKMKPTMDHEFKLVGYEAAERGKAAGALMVICETEGGKRFNVTPVGTLAHRIALKRKMDSIEANNKTHFENHWKDRMLIVTFEEWSKDKVPLRAITEMVIRTWA